MGRIGGIAMRKTVAKAGQMKPTKKGDSFVQGLAFKGADGKDEWFNITSKFNNPRARKGDEVEFELVEGTTLINGATFKVINKATQSSTKSYGASTNRGSRGVNNDRKITLLALAKVAVAGGVPAADAIKQATALEAELNAVLGSKSSTTLSAKVADGVDLTQPVASTTDNIDQDLADLDAEIGLE